MKQLTEYLDPNADYVVTGAPKETQMILEGKVGRYQYRCTEYPIVAQYTMRQTMSRHPRSTLPHCKHQTPNPIPIHALPNPFPLSTPPFQRSQSPGFFPFPTSPF